MHAAQRKNDLGIILGHDVGLRPGEPEDRDVREHFMQEHPHGARAVRCRRGC
jgi:cupin superfamily acireductone dioxygenase involved in methionine salvage